MFIYFFNSHHSYLFACVFLQRRCPCFGYICLETACLLSAIVNHEYIQTYMSPAVILLLKRIKLNKLNELIELPQTDSHIVNLESWALRELPALTSWL